MRLPGARAPSTLRLLSSLNWRTWSSSQKALGLKIFLRTHKPRQMTRARCSSPREQQGWAKRCNWHTRTSSLPSLHTTHWSQGSRRWKRMCVWPSFLCSTSMDLESWCWQHWKEVPLWWSCPDTPFHRCWATLRNIASLWLLSSHPSLFPLWKAQRWRSMTSAPCASLLQVGNPLRSV